MQRLKDILAAVVISGLLAACPAQAQGPCQSAPLPGLASPGSRLAAVTAYQQLPLSVSEAQYRIDELKNLLKDSRPAQIAEAVQQMSEWLSDMAEAHQRLSKAFAKSETVKAQAESEHQAALKFAGLRNQVLLLKADILIKQNRFPEALGPLVDIVVAEPQTAVGKEAYKKLKEIGFAEALEIKSALPADNAALKTTMLPVESSKAPVVPAKVAIAMKAPVHKKTSGQTPRAAVKATGKKIIKGSPFGQY